MQDVQTIVQRHIEAFGEPDAARWRKLLEALFSADCTNTDPYVDPRGVEQRVLRS